MAGSDVVTYRAGILGASGVGKSTALWCIALALECTWVFDPQRGHRVPIGGIVARPDHTLERDDRNGGRYYEDAEKLARLAAKTGACTVVLDEANTVVRRGHQAPPGVGLLLHEGRHLPTENPTGVGCVICARRPAELPPHWWSQVEHLFVFRLTNPRDHEWARSVGIPDDVKTLPKGSFYHLDLRNGEPPHRHAHVLDNLCNGQEPLAA